jgi:hypothetical protein
MLKCTCGQGSEPAEAGDDAGVLEQPPRLTRRGDWPEPAAASAMAASIVTAVPALYSPNPRWPGRQDRQPQASAAAGRPKNTGTAARLCAAPARLGRVSASGAPGG